MSASCSEDIEREFQQIVVVSPEAFLLLVEIAIENDDVVGASACRYFCCSVSSGQRDEIEIILRHLLELAELDHVPRRAEGHGAQRVSPRSS